MKSEIEKTPIDLVTEQSCCGVTPLYQPSVNTAQAEEAARLFTALADSTRLTILNMLASSEAGEVCVCDITSSFNLGQPTISHHLRILRDAGLVRGDKRGKWVYYSLAKTKVEEAQKLLSNILNVALAV